MQLNYATYGSFKAVTPSDSTLINCRAIYVGGAGDLTISPDATTAGVVVKAPPVGTVLPIELSGGRVMAATTASQLLALA